MTSEQAKQLRALADRVETLVGVIDIPTLVAAGPDMFGDFNLTPRDETAAVAAVVSNLRPPEVVKASAILIAILWHHAPEIAQILRAHASLIDADTGVSIHAPAQEATVGPDTPTWPTREPAIDTGEGRS